LKLQIIIGLLFLLLALGFLYAKTIDFAYVDWDDYENYVENTHITNINTENLSTHFQQDRYKSLALYSFMLDYQLWQYNPGLSHLVNVLLKQSQATPKFMYDNDFRQTIQQIDNQIHTCVFTKKC
jgi:hypothetical protein